MEEDISCVFDGVFGEGAIFISNYQAASNLELLRSLNIGAVISIAKMPPLKHPLQHIPHYLHIPALDKQDYKISAHFQQTNQFIEMTRKKTNILVHCIAGISRSSAIIIAYLMWCYGYDFSFIMKIIKRRRNKVQPNLGFVKILKQYGSKCVRKKHMSPFQRKEEFTLEKKKIGLKKAKSVYEEETQKHNFKVEQIQEVDKENDMNKDNKLEEIHEERFHIEAKLAILKSFCSKKKKKQHNRSKSKQIQTKNPTPEKYITYKSASLTKKKLF